MNIPGASGGDNSKSQSNDEISIEEMNKLIEQAAKEMEMDAHKALEDLQKDKEIMKKLQEIKSRKKEDVNKGIIILFYSLIYLQKINLQNNTDTC